MAVARRTLEHPGADGRAMAPALPTSVLLLLAALSACITAQGGYYAGGQLITAVLVAAGLLSAARAHALTGDDLRFGPVLAAAALAAWTVLVAWINGGSALPVVALLAAVTAVLVVCRRLPSSGRDGLAVSLLGIGVLVALSGWAGVAWRLDPLALEDQELWRAATTLTYANAAAGLLVPLALLGLGRQLGRRPSPLGAVVTCLLLAGAGATLSRGGAVALVAGLVCLGALAGGRRTASALLAPAVGAAVVLAGLAPSMPAGTGNRPGVALVALLAGVAVTVALDRAPATARRMAIVVGAAAVAAVAVLGPFDARMTVASEDRRAETAAALDLVTERPLTGTGPGRATLFFDGPDGQPVAARYAHNEYLQMLTELGLTGLALVAVLLASVGRAVRAGRAAAPAPALWAGAAAGLVAFAVHSAFDFLWHVPALPLAGALLAGVALSTTTKENA